MESLELELERFGAGGWFFLKSRRLPGLLLCGPTPESIRLQLDGAINLLMQDTADNG